MKTEDFKADIDPRLVGIEMEQEFEDFYVRPAAEYWRRFMLLSPSEEQISRFLELSMAWAAAENEFLYQYSLGANREETKIADKVADDARIDLKMFIVCRGRITDSLY